MKSNGDMSSPDQLYGISSRTAGLSYITWEYLSCVIEKHVAYY